MAEPPRARWIAGGNIATGFFVVGNVVTGFIAIGNVARGFIAIGNLAIGVIAIGNVGIGIVGGFGATVALGMFAASGVAALPILDGTAGVMNLAEANPFLGIIPILAWLVGARVFPGRRAPRPGPPLTSLTALAGGGAAEGWIRARAERAEGDAIRLLQGRRPLLVPASPEALRALGALRGDRPRVVALLRAEERVREHEGGYREAGERERVLVCAELAAAPAPVPPWVDAGEVQWWLARAWLVGAAVAALGLVVKLVAP